MKVHVLGSGTSVGVPIIGCRCPVCASDDPRNKRLRTSIAVEVDERWLLIDCSIDFRQQMLRFTLPRIDALLLTHTHADHIGGIDDLRIYNWRQREPMPVFSTPPMLDDLRQRYYYCFNPRQQGGGVPQLALNGVEAGERFEAAGIPVTAIGIDHGTLPILGFRIGPLAYLTDCSAIPEASRPLLRGIDTLILSALRHTPHPTHFTLEQAMAEAERIAPRRVFFTHIGDELDHESTNAALPDWANLLYDEQVIEIEDGGGA
jgi:phosphoribosyl 1,2-cyclic phosphate phosphodiesterase